MVAAATRLAIVATARARPRFGDGQLTCVRPSVTSHAPNDLIRRVGGRSRRTGS